MIRIHGIFLSSVMTKQKFLKPHIPMLRLLDFWINTFSSYLLRKKNKINYHTITRRDGSFLCPTIICFLHINAYEQCVHSLLFSIMTSGHYSIFGLLFCKMILFLCSKLGGMNSSVLTSSYVCMSSHVLLVLI